MNTPQTTDITRISVGRVFNLGNYEHVRYEITADVVPGNAGMTIVALERLIEGLRPERSIKSLGELERDGQRIAEMKTMSAASFERQHGNPVGGPDEYIKRCQASLDEEKAKREASLSKAKRIRQLFDDLGGAAVYKDAKLSWDDGDYHNDE